MPTRQIEVLWIIIDNGECLHKCFLETPKGNELQDIIGQIT
uniref:Uncharacterized protein n=1 Tax=Rhizophora mucronata TaxID=61149 RepID=A0A2P2Q1E4_RHIMU